MHEIRQLRWNSHIGRDHLPTGACCVLRPSLVYALILSGTKAPAEKIRHLDWPMWLWLKKRTVPNGARVSGNMDQHLRNPSCVILSQTHVLEVCPFGNLAGPMLKSPMARLLLGWDHIGKKAAGQDPQGIPKKYVAVKQAIPKLPSERSRIAWRKGWGRQEALSDSQDFWDSSIGQLSREGVESSHDWGMFLVFGFCVKSETRPKDPPSEAGHGRSSDINPYHGCLYIWVSFVEGTPPTPENTCNKYGACSFGFPLKPFKKMLSQKMFPRKV